MNILYYNPRGMAALLVSEEFQTPLGMEEWGLADVFPKLLVFCNNVPYLHFKKNFC